MQKFFQVIEFEHSVEVHPLCEKDISKSQKTLDWHEAQNLAMKTLGKKLNNHNEHYENWEDPKDLDIINKLKETKNILEISSQKEYLESVFFN
jgi:hypothetical protein